MIAWSDAPNSEADAECPPSPTSTNSKTTPMPVSTDQVRAKWESVAADPPKMSSCSD